MKFRVKSLSNISMAEPKRRYLVLGYQVTSIKNVRNYKCLEFLKLIHLAVNLVIHLLFSHYLFIYLFNKNEIRFNSPHELANISPVSLMILPSQSTQTSQSDPFVNR